MTPFEKSSERTSASADTIGKVNLRPSKETRSDWTEAARLSRMTLHDFCEQAIHEAASRVLKSEARAA